MIERRTGFLASGHLPTLAAALLYFDVSFMAWVLLGPIAPFLREEWGLSATQQGLLTAIPLLGGSLFRRVFGMLADRIGGRRTGLIGLALTLLPRALGWKVAHTPAHFYGIGFLLGSQTVGRLFVSRHAAPRGRRGSRVDREDRVQPERIEIDRALADKSDIDFLHEIGSRIAAADPLHAVLSRVVQFVSSVVQCDSCFIYILEQDDLVLRASKNPHPEVVDRLTLRVGQGITGWVAQHGKPVAIGRHAFQDPRFQLFNELPEDRYEAFLSVPLLSRGKLVGVINVQHREPHNHGRREIQLISMIGFLVGAEIEMARLEIENSQLSERLEARKVVDRAKGILQRELGITEEEAYLTIQRQSRQRRKSKREIAEAIILGDELRRGKGPIVERP